MKRVYITGICGLVGSNLAKELIRRGYTVRGCDNLIGGYDDNLPSQDGNRLRWSLIDVLDTYALSHDIGDKTDIVVHTAALAYEGLSVFSPKLICENIYAGTASVASAALQHKVPLFINCSSMARYGAQEPPFTENMIPAPEDPYGLAKVQAEQLLNMLSDIHGMKVLHVVPHNIIGTGQKYDDPYRNVAAIFINRMLQDDKVYIYGDGEQRRSFSDISDCIEAMVRLLESTRFPSKSVFNIGPDHNEMTINDLALEVCLVTGKGADKLVYLPARPQEVKDAWCSSEKAKKELNYNPQMPLEFTLRSMTEWIKHRGVLKFDYKLPLEIINDKTPITWVKKL